MFQALLLGSSTILSRLQCKKYNQDCEYDKKRLYATQGGPIILSRIENEYGPMEYELGAPGKAYTEWAAKMVVDQGTGVPWVMCKQDDVPDPVINACNGFYCDYFSPNKPWKPKMWTEAWTGWFTEFGGPVPYRPARDLAFSMAKFILKRGSFINYYMFHGGTNFGRTASGPFIATSHDYDASLNEYAERQEARIRVHHDSFRLESVGVMSNHVSFFALVRTDFLG